jgi:hypothetical protein
MQWLKAAGSGLIGSLVLFVVMVLGVQVTGMAPFNLPPSAAFLEALGLNIGPLAPVGHFAYGALWAVILLALFGQRVRMANALGLAGVQWLLLMVVYAPVIGWGFFGIGGPAHQLPADAPLYLGVAPKFLVMTLVLHAVYGAINGWLIPRWAAGTARSSAQLSGAR